MNSVCVVSFYASLVSSLRKVFGKLYIVLVRFICIHCNLRSAPCRCLASAGHAAGLLLPGPRTFLRLAGGSSLFCLFSLDNYKKPNPSGCTVNHYRKTHHTQVLFLWSHDTTKYCTFSRKKKLP